MQLKTYTDTELIENYQQTREEKYIATLYQRYAHLVYGSALNYLKNKAEAQDMVTHVFVKILKILPEREITNFSSFLYTITRNESISKLRKLKTEAGKLEDFTKFEKSQENFVENDGLLRLDSETEGKEALLHDALNQLTPDQKKCISLFFFDNMSYKEIVESTNYTLSQVKSNLQNGKRNLRILLETKLK